VGLEGQSPARELLLELGNSGLQRGIFDGDAELTEFQIQQTWSLAVYAVSLVYP
jgi:hypothetical protein